MRVLLQRCGLALAALLLAAVLVLLVLALLIPLAYLLVTWWPLQAPAAG